MTPAVATPLCSQMKEAQISYMLKKIPIKRFGLRSIEARLECSHGGENDRYDAIVANYRQFADSIGIKGFVAMPISGFMGDNITTRSPNTPWYTGLPLIEHLETVALDVTSDQANPFRTPVGQPAHPRLPGLFRADRQRRAQSRRRRAGAAFGQDLDGDAHCYARW